MRKVIRSARATEKRLNELPQFVTEIDSQRVHFAHVRSADPGATALVLTHGFPSSFAEFEEVIALLPDFHLVVPSLSPPPPPPSFRVADRLDPDDPVDKLIRERMDAFTREDSDYPAIRNTRPQTIGYGLTDSPALQLAWIAEKFAEWTERPVDRERLLTTVALYGFTATAAHTLYDQAHSADWGAPPTVPQAFAVFGADETVRKLIAVPAGTRWTEFPHARHFPALEAPTDLAGDLRAFLSGRD
ncbi:epoxide hydrolase N-terminal domain-containing protein [Actinoplanes sp. NPDC049596]|uniref:epoxide hydrolase family protein n=1 Tax=unclassified Actinoplanes TaxID=2626549 RepID=UPI00341E2BE6